MGGKGKGKKFRLTLSAPKAYSSVQLFQQLYWKQLKLGGRVAERRAKYMEENPDDIKALENMTFINAVRNEAWDEATEEQIAAVEARRKELQEENLALFHKNRSPEELSK